MLAWNRSSREIPVLAAGDIRSKTKCKMLREDQHCVKKNERVAFIFNLSQAARKLDEEIKFLSQEPRF